MKTLNYLRWIKVTLAVLCLQFSACEKEVLNFKNVPGEIPFTSNRNAASTSDWSPCGDSKSFFLKDESGSAIPFGNIPPGKVSISSTMDSIRLEIKMNSYWKFLNVAYRITPDATCPSEDCWERLTCAKPESSTEIRIARPKGTLATVQVVVQSQHCNLIGIPNYRSKLSIGWDSNKLDDRQIPIPLPVDCDPVATNVRSSSN